MPTLVHGAINVSSAYLKTTASLENLLDIAKNSKPQPKTFEAGWGSIGDSVTVLGTTGAVSLLVGNPSIVEEDAMLPRRLEMRAYWWEVDRTVLRFVGEGRQEEALKLEAADIIISPLKGEENALVVLVSTRNAKIIRTSIKPLLEELIQETDSNAIISLDAEPLDQITEDFFLWLVHKGLVENQISDNLEIVELREAQAIDRAIRRSRLSQGVTIDRPELLALIATQTTGFGPVKLTVDYAPAKLELSCEIDFRGSFGIYNGGSGFNDPPEVEQQWYVRVLFVLYYAHCIYPELVSTWLADTSWASEDRDKFREEYRKALKDSL